MVPQNCFPLGGGGGPGFGVPVLVGHRLRAGLVEVHNLPGSCPSTQPRQLSKKASSEAQSAARPRHAGGWPHTAGLGGAPAVTTASPGQHPLSQSPHSSRLRSPVDPSAQQVSEPSLAHRQSCPCLAPSHCFPPGPLKSSPSRSPSCISCRQPPKGVF